MTTVTTAGRHRASVTARRAQTKKRAQSAAGVAVVGGAMAAAMFGVAGAAGIGTASADTSASASNCVQTLPDCVLPASALAVAVPGSGLLIGNSASPTPPNGGGGVFPDIPGLKLLTFGLIGDGLFPG